MGKRNLRSSKEDSQNDQWNYCEISNSSQDEDNESEDGDYDDDDVDYLPSSQEFLPEIFSSCKNRKDTQEEYREYREWLRHADKGKNWLTRAKQKERESKPYEEKLPDTGHTIFPNEIWDRIFGYLPELTLRHMTLVCKNLRCIANRFLWAIPEFNRYLDTGDLESLQYLPIRKLKTCDLGIRKNVTKASIFCNIFSRMECLNELEVSYEKSSQNLSLRTLAAISPFVTSFSTDAVPCRNADGSMSKYVEKLVAINFPKLKSVTLKRECYPTKYGCFTADHVQSLAAVFPITNIWTSALKSVSNGCSTSYPQLQTLSQVKSLKRIVVCDYSLSNADAKILKLMRDRGVVVELNHSWNISLVQQLNMCT